MKSLVSIQRNYNITNWDREIKKGWKNTNNKKKTLNKKLNEMLKEAK